MSTVAAKPERRKKVKPMVSFGSSSGASSNLPSQQVHGNKSHYEASGSITGWSAQKRSRKDKLTVYPRKTRSVPNYAQSSSDSTALFDGVKDEDRALEHQPLTESNGTDIISHMLTVLEENGPSLEEEQPTKLEPEKARRVLAEHDNFLLASPRIHTAA